MAFTDPKLTQRLVRWAVDCDESSQPISHDEAANAIQTALEAGDNQALTDAINQLYDDYGPDAALTRRLYDIIEFSSVLADVYIEDDGEARANWGGQSCAMVLVHRFDEDTLKRIEANLDPYEITKVLSEHGMVSGQGGLGFFSRFLDLGQMGDFAQAYRVGRVAASVIKSENTGALSQLDRFRYSSLITDRPALRASLIPGVSVGPLKQDPNLMDQNETLSDTASGPDQPWRQSIVDLIAQASGLPRDHSTLGFMRLIEPQSYWNAVKTGMLLLNSVTANQVVEEHAHARSASAALQVVLRYAGGHLSDDLCVDIGAAAHGKGLSTYRLYGIDKTRALLEHQQMAMEQFAKQSGSEIAVDVIHGTS